MHPLLPQVEAVDAFRAYRITYDGQPATFAGGDSEIAGRYGRRAFTSGQNIYHQLAAEPDTCIVSEPFANKHHVTPGDVLTLRLGQQDVHLRVLDVYYDYASERGYVVVDRKTLLHYLPDPAPSNVAVYL